MAKIAILGYGKEGQAVETYFKEHSLEGEKSSAVPEITIFDTFTAEELANFNLDGFDAVFRSPSVQPHLIPGNHANLSSATRFFFHHCPCPIIGVTGTKGKGTTCSMIAAILREYFAGSDTKIHLVGNIGTPAIEILDEIQPSDIVVYELSSFQLWDLDVSPQIAVILRVEPDHLDRHLDFADYVSAKTNLVRYQKPDDTCIYFKNNETSKAIAMNSKAHRIAYPDHAYDDLISHLSIPGEHNKENAAAAVAAVVALISRTDKPLTEAITTALSTFTPLSHHIELVRTLSGVDYYDDSFSASYPALDVALKSFEDRPTILIAGGKDRHLDLTATKRRIFDAKNLVKAILIGETAQQLANGEDAAKYEIASSLKEAVEKARAAAIDVKGSFEGPKSWPSDSERPEQADKESPHQTQPVVLLSPGAASFDMFENFYDRGDQFQAIVKELQ